MKSTVGPCIRSDTPSGLAHSQYWWNVIQAVSTVLAVFATGWAAWAAAKAAQSAHESVELASANAERELRAYVACTDVRVKEVEADKKPVVDAVITNSGVTPAHDMRLEIATFMDASVQTKEMVAAEREKQATPMGILAGKDAMTANPKPKQLSAADINDIAEDRKALYVVTITTYRDVFGKRCRSKRWHRYTAENRKSGKPGAYVCPHGHAYEYDIGEDA